MYQFAVGIRSYGNRFRKIELPAATESQKNVFVCGEILKAFLETHTAEFYAQSTSNPSSPRSEQSSKFKKLSKEQKKRVSMKLDSACEKQITAFENDFGFEIKTVINGKLNRNGSLRMLNEHLKSLENEFLAEYSSRDFLFLHHLVSLKEELSKKLNYFYKPEIIYREELFKEKKILLTKRKAKAEFYNLKKGDQVYYEELAQFKAQKDIDEFKNRFGESYFIPYSILRYGKSSNPVDFKYVNAEARVFKQIMNDEDVKKFFKDQTLREAEKKDDEEEENPEVLSRIHKNKIRRSILDNSKRSEYGFPKNYRPPSIQQSINDYRLSKGLTTNVTFRILQKVWYEISPDERDAVMALREENTKKYLEKRKLASMKAIANEDWLCLQRIEVESYGTKEDINNWTFAWEVVFNQAMLDESQ